MKYLNKPYSRGKELDKGMRSEGGAEGRRQRMFNAGELALVSLHLMEMHPRHGYDIIREFESRTGGAYAPSPGIVYPTLTTLEESGQIEAMDSKGAKRLFGITTVGRAFIAEHKAEVDAALDRMEKLRVTDNPIESGPVSRAMRNLTTVLEQSLNGSVDKETLFNIVDLIDEAARKIERLQ